jgi:hypothetical protein
MESISFTMKMQTIEPIDPKELYLEIHKQIIGIENLELLILKGHLLIEFVLNLAIDRLSKVKINSDRLRFTDKVNLVQRLGLYSKDRNETIATVKIFNNVRNALAHDLKFDKSLLQPLFDKITRTTNENFEGESDIAKLQRSIGSLTGRLAGQLQSTIIIHNQYAELTTMEFKQKTEKILAQLLKEYQKAIAEAMKEVKNPLL